MVLLRFWRQRGGSHGLGLGELAKGGVGGRHDKIQLILRPVRARRGNRHVRRVGQRPGTHAGSSCPREVGRRRLEGPSQRGHVVSLLRLCSVLVSSLFAGAWDLHALLRWYFFFVQRSWQRDGSGCVVCCRGSLPGLRRAGSDSRSDSERQETEVAGAVRADSVHDVSELLHRVVCVRPSCSSREEGMDRFVARCVYPAAVVQVKWP